MAELGSLTHALEQLAARRSELALTVGRYAEATEPLLAWFAAGRPGDEKYLTALIPLAQTACNAVFDLERQTAELGDVIRAAQTPTVPATVGVKAVQA